ncbi:exosortase/archaeosortase family protein [bacterium]|jgi:exosortase|nr:exosortase/archaeosortase family protein [bacterium]
MSEIATNEKTVDQKPGFLEEFTAFWRVLPNKEIFIVLGVCWVALFHFLGNSTFGYVDTGSIFSWMYNSFNAPDSEDSHGNLIPFVVLALIWWKRDILVEIELKQWRMAFPLIVVAIILHLFGFVAQQPRISVVALFLGLYGIMGLCWGPKWMRNIFFPYFLLAFCVPIGSMADIITFPLRILVTQISVGFASGVLQLDIIREGTLIFDGDRSFQFDVAPACSGIRSLITLFALTTIYGFVSYKAFWRRGVMMLASVPLAILGNVLRITTVIVVGDVYGMKAGVAIEQKLGFLTFLVAIIGIMVLGHFLNEEQPVAEQNDEK